MDDLQPGVSARREEKKRKINLLGSQVAEGRLVSGEFESWERIRGEECATPFFSHFALARPIGGSNGKIFDRFQHMNACFFFFSL